MTTNRPWSAWLLILVLAYSFVVIIRGIVYEPLAPSEARTIFMGREMITDWWTGGVFKNPALEELIHGNLGSVAIAPAALAIADGAGRIYGARLLCGGIGLLLVGLVYLTGNTPQYGRRGLLAASTFVFLGVPLQLSSCAGSDVFAAVFFGASLWCIEGTTKTGAMRERRRMLLLGGLLFALAAMTSYLVVLFFLSFVLIAVLRHRFSHTLFFFVLPVLVLLSVYTFFAVLPFRSVLARSLLFHRNPPAVFSSLSFGYLFNWLAMPLLLATIGIFHEEGGMNSLLIILLTLPAFLIQFVSADVNDVHTIVLFSMIILAPAAVLGIVQMADIFTANNTMALARPFFVGAILIIIWVFGVQQIKELIGERPNLSPAISFLRGQGAATVLVDSDYGSPEYVYHYYLDEHSPPMRVVSIARADEKGREDLVKRMHPRYVVLDDHHSGRSFNEASRDYLQQGFAVAATYKIPLVSGDNIIRIFKKGAI